MRSRLKLSEIDWCEENYTHSNNIAEFKNTVSCLAFLILSYIFYDKSRKGWREFIGSILLCFVGISSMWFHSTLSLIGQIMDEISIVLLLNYYIICITWNPADMRVVTLQLNLLIPSILMLFYFPTYNRYILLIYGVTFGVYFLTSGRVQYRKTKYVCFYIVLSLICWIIDIAGYACLHDYWHILIALAAYEGLLIVTD